MRSITVLPFLLLALAVRAETPWKDVTMAVYRNWFGEELPHLEAVEEDGVAPDLTLKLREPTAVNIFGRSPSNVVARLAGCILRGRFVPGEDGAYYLTLAKNSAKARLFVDESGKGFVEVPLRRHPKLTRIEEVHSHGNWRQTEKKALGVLASAEPLRLRKGCPLAFKIHFLPGFYGEGVCLQAVRDRQTRDWLVLPSGL